MFHFSTISFFRRHERGWNLKGKVWKPSLSLTFISYRKQMRESIWDESKSLALSLPLKVTRVINLHWRGSQILPWTLQDSPSHHLSAELLWIKRLPFTPPPNKPAVWCLMSQGLLSNRDQEIAVRGQQIPAFMNGVSHVVHTFWSCSLVVLSRPDKLILHDHSVKRLHSWQNNYLSSFWKLEAFVTIWNECQIATVCNYFGSQNKTWW